MRVGYRLNKELDKEIAHDFLGLKAGGIDFTRGVLGPHPELREKLKDGNRSEEIISTYFDAFYLHHADEMEDAVELFTKMWEAVEGTFFNAAKKLFGDGTQINSFVGYVSIIDCNPRFVPENSFQVYKNHKRGPVYVTMHEILHFLFFEYVKNHGGKLAELDTDRGPLWEISEVFNEIVMSEPEFTSIHHQEVDHYPSLVDLLKKGQSIWKTSENIESWANGLYTANHEETA